MQFVIILGAARSGTTMLANLLKQDRRVIYIGEPRYIWKYKNVHVGHDMLTKKHITPEIRNHITTAFQSYFQQNDGDILLEKTPSNSLRFEFVYNLFPDAKYIHIIRNGMDVAFSAKKRWMGNFTDTEMNHFKSMHKMSKSTHEKIAEKLFNNRIRFLDIIQDLHYTFPLYLNNLGLIDQSLWGPCYPSMREDFKKLKLIEVCSLQWKHSVESVINFKNSDEFKGDYHQIRYEEIISKRKGSIKDMFNFSGISYSDRVNQYIDRRIQRGSGDISQYNPEEVQLVNKHCQKLLSELGYHDQPDFD